MLHGEFALKSAWEERPSSALMSGERGEPIVLGDVLADDGV